MPLANIRRAQCPHCGSTGYDVVGSRHESSRYDHARPWGGVCRRAARESPRFVGFTRLGDPVFRR